MEVPEERDKTQESGCQRNQTTHPMPSHLANPRQSPSPLCTPGSRPSISTPSLLARGTPVFRSSHLPSLGYPVSGFPEPHRCRSGQPAHTTSQSLLSRGGFRRLPALTRPGIRAGDMSSLYRECSFDFSPLGRGSTQTQHQASIE